MVIDRLNEHSTANFHLPKDFDAVTAIMDVYPYIPEEKKEE